MTYLKQANSQKQKWAGGGGNGELTVIKWIQSFSLG